MPIGVEQKFIMILQAIFEYFLFGRLTINPKFFLNLTLLIFPDFKMCGAGHPDLWEDIERSSHAVGLAVFISTCTG